MEKCEITVTENENPNILKNNIPKASEMEYKFE
jgi:hypothetical protein